MPLPALADYTFDGAAAPGWPSGWTLSRTGGTLSLTGDGWGRIVRDTQKTGARLTTASLPADREILSTFRYVTTSSWSVMHFCQRADSGLNSGRGYYVEPIRGGTQFTVRRYGTEAAEWTGNITVGTGTLPFTISVDTAYTIRYECVTEVSQVALRVKVWPAAEAEPAAWSGEFFDTTAERILSSHNTGMSVDGGAAAVSFEYDRFTVGAIGTDDYPGTEPDPEPTGAAWSLWDGTVEHPLTLDGVWGGTAIQPAVSSEVVGAAQATVWLNGASLDGVEDQSDPAAAPFAVWRGTPLGIAGTWNDTAAAQPAQWSINPNDSAMPYKGWTAPIDNCVGAIFPANGDTWALAAADATGSYYDRWHAMFTKIRGYRPPETHGTTYIRWAHEFNLARDANGAGGYPWFVAVGQEADFVAAWRIMRAAQQAAFPESRLVWCPNKESTNVTGATSARSTDCWPGADYVDVVGVDWYGAWPGIMSQTDWDNQFMGTDKDGAPKGIGAWQQFATSVGKPMAFPEYGVDADHGDQVAYVNLFLDFCEQNAGTGAGEVEYAVYFNSSEPTQLEDDYNWRFGLHPHTRSPNAAAAYQAWHQARA